MARLSLRVPHRPWGPGRDARGAPLRDPGFRLSVPDLGERLLRHRERRLWRGLADGPRAPSRARRAQIPALFRLLVPAGAPDEGDGGGARRPSRDPPPLSTPAGRDGRSRRSGRVSGPGRRGRASVAVSAGDVDLAVRGRGPAGRLRAAGPGALPRGVRPASLRPRARAPRAQGLADVPRVVGLRDPGAARPSGRSGRGRGDRLWEPARRGRSGCSHGGCRSDVGPALGAARGAPDVHRCDRARPWPGWHRV
jgi:hypothetical protein